MTDLADEIEAAEASEQREMLTAAAVHLRGHSQASIDSWWERWDRLMVAEAYESAAMTLVPEGWTRLTDNTDGKEIVELYPRGPVEDTRIQCGSHPTSLALALCAASLRARKDET